MFWGGFVLHCEGMSEDLTEGQTPWGYCKREDAEDSLVQCADRTERSQRQLQGLESGGNSFTLNKSTQVQRLFE